MATKESRDAVTPTTTHDDGTFIRTALVVDKASGSVDVVEIKDGEVRRLCQINISWLPETEDGPCLIVDTIDVDGRFKKGRALTFSQTGRHAIDVPKGGRLVSADFRGEKPPTVFMVWNDTDGIPAVPEPFKKLEDAEAFVREFPERFEKQGYYKTSGGVCIDPEDVEMRIEECEAEDDEEQS